MQSGLIGYIYRWLRNGGLVAVVMGGGWLTLDATHALQDGRADATVSGIEIVCELTVPGKLADTVAREMDCGEAGARRAASTSVTLAVREVAYAKVKFKSEIGADYASRLRLGPVPQDDVQRGDTVPLLYSRDNPNDVRAITSAGDNLKSAGVLAAGLVMLMLCWLLRRAAAYEGSVAGEVAELEAAYQKRVARPSSTPRRVTRASN